MAAPFGFTGYLGGGPVPDVQMPDGLPVAGGKGSPLVDAFLALQGQRIKDAVTAPRDALSGDLQVMGPDGHPTAEAMDRANGMAGLAMTGSLPMSTPAGSLRMFGGRSAATADHVALNEAQALQRAGADRDHIWDATGWFKAPDGNWKFEIPDDLSTVGTPKNAPAGYSQLHHDDLAQAYPGLWQNTGQSIREAPVTSGRYDALGDVIHAQGPTDAAQHSVALHEMQHVIQRKEGFARGGNPGEFEPASPMAQHMAPGEQAWDTYRRLAGEVEARNVQARANMTPEQRFNTPPWLTQDVHDAQQIVQFNSGGPTGAAAGLPALAASSDPKGSSVSAGLPFGSLALPLPPGVSLEEVLGTLSPQQRAALDGSQAAPAQPPAVPPSLLGAQPPQMPEPSPSAPALPSLVGQPMPAMPQGAGAPPAMPRPPAALSEDEADKPAPNAVPAQGRAPLSLAPPAAPAAPAPPQAAATPAPPAASGAASPAGDGFDMGGALNRFRKNGGFETLGNIGVGLMSTHGFGNGLAAGLKLDQDATAKRAVTDLAKAEFGIKQQKAAQEQRQLTGNAQYVMGKIPGISADQAVTLGSNSTFMNELFKGVLPPSELFKQFSDKDGNIWSQNSRTGQATVALKADEDKTMRPLTDPAERAKFGIPADDSKPYQVDANNKVSAIGGGGTSVSVDLGKKAAGEADAQILKKIDTSYDKAQGAIGTLGAISRQKQALDQGIIAGWGSNLRTNAQAMAEQLLGISPDEKLSPTYSFDAASKQKGAELAKAISQAGHTTNMDLNLGNTIAGGDRDKTEKALRSIIDAQEMLAKDAIAHHNAGVDRYVGASPEMKDRMGWYHVETPEVYRYGQGTPNPVADPGSAPAPATRTLNGKTYSRGPDGHWYEGR